MKDGGVIKQGEVYFALKERADEKSPQQIVEYLQEITRFAEFYAKLLDPALEQSATVSHQMHRLNRVELRPPTHSSSISIAISLPERFPKRNSLKYWEFWRIS